MAHGKRAGSRKGAKPRRTFRPVLLGLAGAVTVAVVAWGYLVYAAIDFGTQARAGRSEAWWLLILASLGAVACLFLGLILVAKLSRALGITQPPATAESQPHEDQASPPGHDPDPSTADPSTGSHRAIR